MWVFPNPPVAMRALNAMRQVPKPALLDLLSHEVRTRWPA